MNITEVNFSILMYIIIIWIIIYSLTILINKKYINFNKEKIHMIIKRIISSILIIVLGYLFVDSALTMLKPYINNKTITESLPFLILFTILPITIIIICTQNIKITIYNISDNKYKSIYSRNKQSDLFDF